jgi:hypothetical protein
VFLGVSLQMAREDLHQHQGEHTTCAHARSKHMQAMQVEKLSHSCDMCMLAARRGSRFACDSSPPQVHLPARRHPCTSSSNVIEAHCSLSLSPGGHVRQQGRRATSPIRALTLNIRPATGLHGGSHITHSISAGGGLPPTTYMPAAHASGLLMNVAAHMPQFPFGSGMHPQQPQQTSRSYINPYAHSFVGSIPAPVLAPSPSKPLHVADVLPASFFRAAPKAASRSPHSYSQHGHHYQQQQQQLHQIRHQNVQTDPSPKPFCTRSVSLPLFHPPKSLI